ncbi:unnamed protein product [Nezara viridula]|uniref:Uncharacterized protein n=1 Tax=Nezara viridula TaxID=85310 RepID=A0A9P0GUY9_NEZVI|nr:unnamed protein product [Nezara viridula]
MKTTHSKTKVLLEVYYTTLKTTKKTTFTGRQRNYNWVLTSEERRSAGGGRGGTRAGRAGTRRAAPAGSRLCPQAARSSPLLRASTALQPLQRRPIASGGVACPANGVPPRPPALQRSRAAPHLPLDGLLQHPPSLGFHLLTLVSVNLLQLT